MQRSLTAFRGVCAACARRAASSSRPGVAAASLASMASQQQSSVATNPLTNPNTIRRHFSESSKSSKPVAETQAACQSPSHHTLKPPSYYDLFPHSLPDGAPPNGPFHIDVRALRREFLRLQAAAHPDFHHAASSTSATHPDAANGGRPGHSVARAQAERESSRINEAYRTLASPLLRAQYLLRERYGLDLATDESTIGKTGGAAADADPELLMAVMEAREEIEGAGSEAELAGLRDENEGRIQASEETLSRAFARDDADAARAETVRLRYWINIRDSINNWEAGKGPMLQH